MAHMALPGDYRFEITHTTVEIGPYSIPLGEVKKILLPKSNEVNLWSEGAMGLKGKIVSLHFECESADRVKKFVAHILFSSQARVSFYATQIRDSGLTSNSSGLFTRSLEFSFEDVEHCDRFNTLVAPNFFPGFNRVAEGRILKVSIDGAEKEVQKVTKEVIDRLSEQTDREEIRSLHLIKELSPSPTQLSSLSPAELPSHYYHISPKEIKIRNKGNLFQPMPEPPHQVLTNMIAKKEEILVGLKTIEEYLTYKEPDVDDAIDELKALLNKDQLVDALQFHIMQNLMSFLKKAYEQMKKNLSAPPNF